MKRRDFMKTVGLTAIVGLEPVYAEADSQGPKCDICGRGLTFNGETVIGIAFSTHDAIGAHPEGRRIVETFGKSEFTICFTCWLKSLGIKPMLR